VRVADASVVPTLRLSTPWDQVALRTSVAVAWPFGPLKSMASVLVVSAPYGRPGGH
jgi:hypothetical protein